MKFEIIPTIFSHNKKEFDVRLNKLSKYFKKLQIDFMDGKFVKSKSVLIGKIPNLKKYNINFEAHLMIKNPEIKIKQLHDLGFKKIIFHYEAIQRTNRTEHVIKLIKLIKSYKMKPIIAINPGTKINVLFDFIPSVNHILFLGVHPGKEHQKLILSVLKKIKELRKLYSKLTLQLDGGFDGKNIQKLYESGLNIVNSGSYVFNSDNPKKTVSSLLNSI